jgi:hypothetical protein
MTMVAVKNMIDDDDESIPTTKQTSRSCTSTAANVGLVNLSQQDTKNASKATLQETYRIRT